MFLPTTGTTALLRTVPKSAEVQRRHHVAWSGPVTSLAPNRASETFRKRKASILDDSREHVTRHPVWLAAKTTAKDLLTGPTTLQQIFEFSRFSDAHERTWKLIQEMNSFNEERE